jgi:predicted lactoylglutathione lyase
LIELNRGLARLDLLDFELASRNDVDALGAFLEENGMNVVDAPGEYYGRSYYAVYFTDPDGMKLEAMVVQAAAEEAPGGKDRDRGKPTERAG